MAGIFAIAALGILLGTALIENRERRARAHRLAVESVLCRPRTCDIASDAERPAA
jgi:hypothetical protein